MAGISAGFAAVFGTPVSGITLLLTRSFFSLQRPWLPTRLAAISTERRTAPARKAASPVKSGSTRSPSPEP